ncbi:hypothetical protein ACJBCE_36625 [Streptomyces sp. NBUL23]|uniref:hypothetical protein n=1 Tax=Streptomyces sp. NBUL23 TaxID=3381354 RepID=UPI003871EAC4
MRRHRPFRDTTAERASISNIGYALTSIGDRREVAIVVLAIVWGLSVRDSARRMGVTERQAEVLLHKVLFKLRHPSRSGTLSAEADGEDVARSKELRRWAEAVERSLLVTCSCGSIFLPDNIFLATGGRPKRYCSNACRQAAYRARKKQRGNQ